MCPFRILCQVPTSTYAGADPERFDRGIQYHIFWQAGESSARLSQLNALDVYIKPDILLKKKGGGWWILTPWILLFYGTIFHHIIFNTVSALRPASAVFKLNNEVPKRLNMKKKQLVSYVEVLSNWNLGKWIW